jgi:hypothetical protein
MLDHRFDGGAAAHLAFDLRGDTALLLGRVDLELVIGRRVVAAVAGVGVQALDLIADELFDRRDDLCERVSEFIAYSKANPGKINMASSVMRGREPTVLALMVGRYEVINAPEIFSLVGLWGSSAQARALEAMEVPLETTSIRSVPNLARHRCGCRRLIGISGIFPQVIDASWTPDAVTACQSCLCPPRMQGRKRSALSL